MEDFLSSVQLLKFDMHMVWLKRVRTYWHLEQGGVEGTLEDSAWKAMDQISMFACAKWLISGSLLQPCVWRLGI